MVKRKLKKLLALALSILLLSSNFTELIPHAQAAEPETPTTADTGVKDQFRDNVNGRPNLFVDFLGDNNKFRADHGAETVALDTLVAPGAYDQSTDTNKPGPGNSWARYVAGDITSATANTTIFWVGIGIDRKEIFQLLEDGQGLTSFEGGFYYDSNIIEPYIDPQYIPAGKENDEETLRAAYRETIADANIASRNNYPANTQWSDNYAILRAETGLAPTTEPITQEELRNPSISQILSGQYDDGVQSRDWKMTYVSLELKDIETGARRLAGVYDEYGMYKKVTDPGTGKVIMETVTDENGNTVQRPKLVTETDENGNEVPVRETPPKAQGTGLEDGEAQIDSDYQYLLLIPFRLKAYGYPDRLHLRLLRNATHFSIGAGTYGVDPYGAWERVTTRNPGKDLKLLTNFTGDLYLFGSKPKADEVLYDALLKIINGGGAENTAKLSVNGDPAVWPVWADTDGDLIHGLQSGIGMQLEVHAQIGYSVKVSVTYEVRDPNGGPNQTISHDFTTSQTGQDYYHTFVMPMFDPPADPGTVTVTVVFEHQNRDTYYVYLSDIPQPGNTFYRDDDNDLLEYKTGNETTITTNMAQTGSGATITYDPTPASNTINTFDPVVPHPNTSHAGFTHAPGPRGEANKEEYVRVHVDTHADYEAVVRIYSFAGKEFTTGFTDLTVEVPTGSSYQITSTAVTLPDGGDIIFKMSETDIDVEVTYRKAQRHKATLEVYHAGTAPVLDYNVAQLAYLAYDDENVPSMVYSGVVYEDYDDSVTPLKDDHRAVKDPTRRLEWISASAAALSGSLGGDTDRAGKVWNPNDLATPLDPVEGADTIMALLASAPDLATFQTQINGLDLSRTKITNSLTGFRKDLYGALYSDADIVDFAAILWELREQIEHNTSLRNDYKKQVQKSNTDPTIAYVYYDLTAAQVQDYLLTIFKQEDANNSNQSGYRTSRRAYLTAQRLYDELKDLPPYNDLVAPIAPEVPRTANVTGDYERQYEDTFYESRYLHDYNQYIAAYQTYIDSARQLGSASSENVTAIDPQLIHNVQQLPKIITVPLNTATQAANNVNDVAAHNKWKTPIIKPDASPDEESDPKVPAHTIYTREGRTVWVVLEADSQYTVQSVELYPQDASGNTLDTTPLATVPVRATGYQNVFSFTMPEEDCVVRVTYTLRDTRNLNITITGADGKKDNTSFIDAYVVNTTTGTPVPLTSPILERRDNDDDTRRNTDPYRPDPIQRVFVGSTVTVTVRVDKDYDVELRMVNHISAQNITPSSSPTDDRDGTYTFVIPASALTEDVDLTIAYSPSDQKTHKAIINPIQPQSIPYDIRNDANWRDGGLYKRLDNVPPGQALTGEITVAPGYYIRSVTAYGVSGNYTYTLTGNGYNGGYGTSLTGTSVPINVFVDMPDEDLIVDVVFGYGIPPAAPENTLTLTVKDDDNVGPDYADNWARAEVYDKREDFEDSLTPELTLGKVGKAINAANLSDRDYVDTGKWVRVDFENRVVTKPDGSIDREKSYYVSKVSVSPSNLGVSLVWEDDHSVSFYMPAGSTGVTVEFSKYPEGRLPTYFLTVQETYRDLSGVPADIIQDDYNDNYVTFANSDTIQSWHHAPITLQPYKMDTGEYNPERLPDTTQSGATGVAEAGEKVTMTFIVDESKWYVQSVVVISDGAAYRGSYELDPAANNSGSKKTYKATFRMPTGDAEFLVHYRRGPKPEVPDYAFTLTLTDNDNQRLDSGLYDENNIVASFVDSAGLNAAGHTDLTVGHNKGAMTEVTHVHAGDTVTLTTTLQPGYTLDYMLVNPSRLKIYPVWISSVVDPDTNVITMTATFTMPTEGVAVVARIIKGKPQEYTANLILHPPAGMTSMNGVGKGTFTDPTSGTLNGYPQSAVFSTYAIPGTQIGYDLYAFDGYYIDRVTIDPDLGATGSLSGAFGYQDGEFNMPAANVNVNVWFKKGWPDEAQYRLTLEVFGADYKTDPSDYDNNFANFTQITHTDAGTHEVLGDPYNEKVYSGGRTLLERKLPDGTTEGVAFDRDTVYVAIHKNSDSYVDSSSIHITDSAGNLIHWWYAPGENGDLAIAFTMPPRSTTVRVTFRPGETPEREAMLHLVGNDASDAATLATTWSTTNASPTSVNANGGEIKKLIAGETLKLTATPGTDRHITAAYAVNRTTGAIIPLTRLDNNARVRADLVYAGGEGEFAMPEANVDVYVKFADGAIEEGALPLKLMVSGVPGSGSARADVTAPGASMTKTDMTVSAPGMDSRFVQEEDQVVATFTPSAGYAITGLEVYDTDGNPVPYEWISVLQDPPSLTGLPGMWLGTAPDNIATHPDWKQNDKLQITFPMPDKGVTIHVTYDTVPDQEFVAQVVVNDEAYSDQPTPSQNNAWLRTAANDVQRKLQNAKPGVWIDLDITVHPGYKIEYIKVVPQSFGIVPGLPLGPFYSQNTGFYMPAGNVTVYVKFVDDGIDERNATLVVTGAPTGDAANYGVISSPRSGASIPVLVSGAPQTVIARPNMDWVSTDYYWNTNGSAYVKKVTVTTTSGVAVPFTQLEDPTTGHGVITFPMVNENVTVRVEYSPQEYKEEVYLHVIDATTGDGTEIGVYAYARMAYPFGTGADWSTGNVTPWRRDAANPWGHTVKDETDPLLARAGTRVRVATNATNGVYLESAYVLYEDMGQMVDLTAANPVGSEKQYGFVVHPGRNDVYVTFTRREPDPNEHAAILMLKAPENSAGRASIAANDVYDGPNVTDQDRLNEANVGHARVVAQEGNRIIIQVAPAEGYIIDSVLVTPLGFPLQSQPVYNYTQMGNTISFDMPHRDIAITVTLKRGTNQHYKATLHYVKDAEPYAIQDINYAQLAWKDGDLNNTIRADEDPNTADIINRTEAEIREGTVVTLTGHLGDNPTDPDHPDTILSAFVLRGGTLVPLSPPLEGKEAVVGTPSNHNATFTMPAGDVDVYLVVTTDPPENPWHTAVLVATDSSPNGTNSGDNLGYLWKNNDTAGRKPAYSLGHPGCAWMAVEEGETFAVRPEATGGYAFVPPATLTCNDGGHGGNMYAESTSPYVYRDTMGTCNKAALITFVSDEALKLTVIVRDPENPSDGSITNELLTRQPTSATPVPDLTLRSTNVGGAYQIMEGVTAGEPILLTATPYNSDIIATAQIHYFDGTVEDIPLTLQANGTFTGSIPMPANNATIIVTFHGNYTGKLTLVDLCADKTSQATMTESTGTAPDQVTVNHLGDWAVLTQLPTGTVLTANMIKDANLAGKTVTAYLSRNSSTSLMTPAGQNAEGVDEYVHTINRASAEIILVVRDKDNKTYLATVETVNKPSVDDGGDPVADPTILATPQRENTRSGDIWTTANEDDTVDITFPVPDGYQVIVTSSHPAGPSGTFTADAAPTFTMPASDVHITLKYVRVDFRLDLVVVHPAGTHSATEVANGANAPLTENGDYDWLTAGQTVELTKAEFMDGVTGYRAFWTADDGSFGTLSVGDGGFPMPEANATVTVIYTKPTDPDPYIALVEIDDPTHNPGNKATTLANTTDAAAFGVSPWWVQGQTGDTIRVTYQIEPGYIAIVTAYKRGDPSTLYAVANVASASNGLATVAMPGNTDVVIRIQYSQEPNPQGDVILQLVAHGTQPGNSANITSPIANTLNPSPILMDGANTPANGTYIVPTDLTSPVETPKVSTSTMGDELRVYAHWAPNYQVVRMTVAVRRADGTETPEVPITVSTYGSSATGRTLMPYVAAGEAALVRVYYGNNFDATFHVVRNGTTGDDTHATDNRGAGTLTSTGNKDIFLTGDKLLDFVGYNGEVVQTTAIPDTDNGQRLVGVVWESRSTGAASAAPSNPTDLTKPYEFTMPTDNVDFYAVYEPSDSHSYIAKVNFRGTAHLGSADNAVTITNSTDAAAAHGSYWTVAKAGDIITVNVKVAEGYKARIVRTHEDAKDGQTGHIDDHFDFYTSRTAFVPNLLLGKDSVFTMPAETDATVTIEFIKGYDLELELTDISKLAETDNENAAKVVAGTFGDLAGASDGSNLGADYKLLPGGYTPVPTSPALIPKLSAVTGGTDIDTTITHRATKDGDTAQYRVLYRTAFGGTVRVDNPLSQDPNGEYTYKMPSADTVETVLFYNNETPLLAKVEVKGESDINGNTATPIKDYTDTEELTVDTDNDGTADAVANKTTTGTVWTTTSEANTIDLTVTVANGYMAKIKVRRDNKNYYDNLNDPSKWDYLDATEFVFEKVTATDGVTAPAEPLLGEYEVQIGYKSGYDTSAFPNDISGYQHFRFKMVDATNVDEHGNLIPVSDVTVIVEFVFAGDIPQPFDPRRVQGDAGYGRPYFLDDGFIYGVNRGDFAMVEIPTLIDAVKDGEKLYHTDNHSEPGTAVKTDYDVEFSFFLYDADKDEYTPLILGTDVLLEPYDVDDTDTYADGDPYNYETGMWSGAPTWHGTATGDPIDYVGSRFKLIPTDPDKTTKKRTAGAQALYDMLNNNGSLESYQEGGVTKYRTTLYVIAEDAVGQKSAYTQVWIRPHFSIQVNVISYAPNHTTTASVYQLIEQDQDAMDLAAGYKDKDGNVVPGVTQIPVDTSLTASQWAREFTSYRCNDNVKPYLSNYTAYDEPVLGANKYFQQVSVMSSELLGGYPAGYDPGKDPVSPGNLDSAFKPHYALTVEKAACLTYTRVDLDLTPTTDFDFSGGADKPPVLPAGHYYDPATLTYTVSDDVYLITGDVDGNGFTKWQDYDTVYTYVWRGRDVLWNSDQTEAPDPADPNYAAKLDQWELSTYNPDSMAYWCDLNGDREISVLDLNLVQTVFDYNRSKDDYLWTTINSDNTLGDRVYPFGFDGSTKVKDTVNNGTNSYIALFSLSLRDMGVPFPVEPDAYWDSLVDPETTDAPPLNNPYVDENDVLWDDPVRLETVGSVPTEGGTSGRRGRGDEVVEIPRGEEAIMPPPGWGEQVELPQIDFEATFGDPEPTLNLPQTYPKPTPALPPDDDIGPGDELPVTPADTFD